MSNSTLPTLRNVNLPGLTVQNIPDNAKILFSLGNLRTGALFDYVLYVSCEGFIHVGYAPSFDLRQSVTVGTIGCNRKYYDSEFEFSDAKVRKAHEAFRFFWQLATNSRQDGRGFEDFPSLMHIFYRVTAK